MTLITLILLSFWSATILLCALKISQRPDNAGTDYADDARQDLIASVQADHALARWMAVQEVLQ